MDDWTDDAMCWSPAVSEKPLARYPRTNRALNRDRWGLVLLIPVAYLAALIGGASIWAFWAAAGLLAILAVDSVGAALRDVNEPDPKLRRP